MLNNHDNKPPGNPPPIGQAMTFGHDNNIIMDYFASFPSTLGATNPFKITANPPPVVNPIRQFEPQVNVRQIKPVNPHEQNLFPHYVVPQTPRLRPTIPNKPLTQVQMHNLLKMLDKPQNLMAPSFADPKPQHEQQQQPSRAAPSLQTSKLQEMFQPHTLRMPNQQAISGVDDLLESQHEQQQQQQQPSRADVHMHTNEKTMQTPRGRPREKAEGFETKLKKLERSLDGLSIEGQGSPKVSGNSLMQEQTPALAQRGAHRQRKNPAFPETPHYQAGADKETAPFAQTPQPGASDKQTLLAQNRINQPPPMTPKPVGSKRRNRPMAAKP
jgi:hypothetical protein